MELQGQRAPVTGVTSGIGRAVAEKLTEAGATVITTGGARHIVADLGNLDDVRRLAGEVGEVDVLVNNAGIFPFRPTLEQVFNVNVRGPYFLTAALLPKMIAKGGGSIINVSSVTARTGTPIMSVYGASKAALDSLRLSWAVEFGGHGIRVNSVAPGPTRTEKVEENLGDAIEQIVAPTPLGRAGEPTEIAEAVLFLASPRSSFLTGSIVTADGGAIAT